MMTTNFNSQDFPLYTVHPSGMTRKDSDGKPRFDLLYPRGVPYNKQLLTRFADLLARGAKEYGARNWEKANSEEELARFIESAARHFAQWINGEYDEDHAAAVLFNIMGAEYVRERLSRH